MYYNVGYLISGFGCMEAFTEQASIWCCYLGTFCCIISGKKRAQSAVTDTWSEIRAVGVLF